jgi:predicted DNA-binding protein (MmcQ/YjbR family)
MTEHPDVPSDTLAQLRRLCTALPATYEEEAWVGTRWRIRKRTFAHVLMIDSGRPPVYARAAGSDGPITVMTFRSSGLELDALRHAGHPFFKPLWPANMVGIALDERVDWEEVAELITESYCVLAPKRLVESLELPTG